MYVAFLFVLFCFSKVNLGHISSRVSRSQGQELAGGWAGVVPSPDLPD